MVIYIDNDTSIYQYWPNISYRTVVLPAKNKVLVGGGGTPNAIAILIFFRFSGGLWFCSQLSIEKNTKRSAVQKRNLWSSPFCFLQDVTAAGWRANLFGVSGVVRLSSNTSLSSYLLQRVPQRTDSKFQRTDHRLSPMSSRYPHTDWRRWEISKQFQFGEYHTESQATQRERRVFEYRNWGLNTSQSFQRYTRNLRGFCICKNALAGSGDCLFNVYSRIDLVFYF